MPINISLNPEFLCAITLLFRIQFLHRLVICLIIFN